MVANILSADSPRPQTLSLTLGWGQKIKLNSFRTWSCCTQIKWNHEWSSMVANILPADHPPKNLLVGSKGQNSTFSEYGYVAYQIKGNDACSNKVANILRADPPPPTQTSPDPGDRVKTQLFFRTCSSCISN